MNGSAKVSTRSAIVDPGRHVSVRLIPLFFVSGAAALTYQLCWQRLLFATFGVDIESVTIVVSVFMLGLGLGALVGGQLADRFPGKALALFALSEFGIGVFGWFSPDLIRLAGDAFVESPHWLVAAVNFFLLLIPTSLMGATLPILVSHLSRLWKNIGRSIGLLYEVNTLGAAVGAMTIGFVWFLFFDLDAAVRSAAVANISISVLTLLWIRRDV